MTDIEFLDLLCNDILKWEYRRCKLDDNAYNVSKISRDGQKFHLELLLYPEDDIYGSRSLILISDSVLQRISSAEFSLHIPKEMCTKIEFGNRARQIINIDNILFEYQLASEDAVKKKKIRIQTFTRIVSCK